MKKHRVVSEGGILTFSSVEAYELHKNNVIDMVLYRFTLLMVLYAMFLFAGWLWLPGPEFGVLIAAIVGHAILISVKGSRFLVRNIEP